MLPMPAFSQLLDGGLRLLESLVAVDGRLDHRIETPDAEACATDTS
ncbi:hypothetical protein ACVJBD_007353 [Rhizobium mongolense]